MRILSLALLVAVAGCDGLGGEPVTELDVDVIVRDASVTIFPREVDRACTCSVEWPRPGECRGASDGITCDCAPPPASCLAEVRLERDGEILAAAPYEAEWASGYIDAAGLPPDSTIASAGGVELVLDGCGDVARIPLDASAVPVATIDEVTVTEDDIRVQWSAVPEGTSSLTSLSNGFVADRCHADGFTGDDSVGAPPAFVDMVYVSAVAFTSEVVDTPLGRAHVWFGEGDVEEIYLATP